MQLPEAHQGPSMKEALKCLTVAMLFGSIQAGTSAWLDFSQGEKSITTVTRAHFFIDIVYCLVHTTYMSDIFGPYIRKKRQLLYESNPQFSLRQVSARIKVQASYLSKVERCEQAPPSEAKIVALAKELKEDPDVLLAMAGKVSTDLQEIIRKRPELFATLIRELKNMPDHAVLRIAREVQDGDW